MVQASAGASHCIVIVVTVIVLASICYLAGKSFLLTTVFLWCLAEDKITKAAAPTGIAAANVEIEGTDVAATTVHNLSDLDGENVSKLDFSKVTHGKVASLIKLQVLLLDEVSMLDDVCFKNICKVLSDIEDCRRPSAPSGGDNFGSIHIVLFGDLKQDAEGRTTINS